MKKILVIEDDNDILENTAEILELSNYKVFTATNGKMGVEQALRNKPDLILCDIMMPELDGYGVLHIIQHNEETESTPFIFFTARAEKEEIRKGMSLGADDYISKPYDPTDLLNTIERRLKKSEAISKKMSGGLKGINELISLVGGEQALTDFVQGRQFDKYKKKQRIYNEGNHPTRSIMCKKEPSKFLSRTMMPKN
jgi:DNA-binding response OmpR family regulator